MSTSFPLDGMRVRFSGATNVGMKRNHNEDSLYLPDGRAARHRRRRHGRPRLGRGGQPDGGRDRRRVLPRHRRGADADLAVQGGPRPAAPTSTGWSTAIKLANLEICEQPQRDAGSRAWAPPRVGAVPRRQRRSSATSATAGSTGCATASSTQLTEDHSLHQRLHQDEAGDPRGGENWPHKNVIVRALGMKETVQVDIVTERRASATATCCAPTGCPAWSRTSRSRDDRPRRARPGPRVERADRRGQRGGRHRQHHRRPGARRAGMRRASIMAALFAAAACARSEPTGTRPRRWRSRSRNHGVGRSAAVTSTACARARPPTPR